MEKIKLQKYQKELKKLEIGNVFLTLTQHKEIITKNMK